MDNRRQTIIEKTLDFVANKGWTDFGDNFLDLLAKFLGEILVVDYVLIDKYSKESPKIAETIAVFNKGSFLPNLKYELVGTPCANVIGSKLCCYVSDIQNQFPMDDLLKQMNVDSYIGIPLWSSIGDPIGLIAIMDGKQLVDIKTIELTLQIVAIKAAQELEKMLYETELQKQNLALKRQAEELKISIEELQATSHALREANFELEKAKDKAEESEQLKTSFLQNMSHEIRTPMNAIIGFSGILDIPDLSLEKRKKYISIIQNSTNQLLTIITDILSISSIETNQTTINIEVVCVNNIISELQEIFKITAQNQNISLFAIQQLTDVESEIFTDITKLTQILTNLLSNALKFTHKGYVEFGYTLKLDLLEFYVKDTGIGIDLGMQDKIFERFRQANDTIKKYGGTGLGLAISKAFVELLGGRIWVQSEIGKGATFYFTIPYKPVCEVKILDSLSFQNKNRTTILIAEDEEFNFLYLEELLTNEKINILHTKDGMQTVELCKSNGDISLILMDIKMPILSGYDAAKQIKKFRPEMIIIAQSAYALAYEKDKYSGSVFDEYITKPINKDKLFKLLAKYGEKK